jgi:hypothetical protein
MNILERAKILFIWNYNSLIATFLKLHKQQTGLCIGLKKTSALIRGGCYFLGCELPSAGCGMTMSATPEAGVVTHGTANHAAMYLMWQWWSAKRDWWHRAAITSAAAWPLTTSSIHVIIMLLITGLSIALSVVSGLRLQIGWH